jgi:hypothetical protein
MTREDEQLAKFAEATRDSEHFKAIIRSLKNETIAAWANEQDTVKRELAWHDLQAIGRVESRFRSLADNLKVERARAETEKKRDALKQQAKNGGRAR